MYKKQVHLTALKVPLFGVILVRIFPAFSRIPTEYGAYLSVFSPNAGNCGKNGDQNNSEHGSFCLNVVIWLMTVNGFNEAKNEKQII